MEFFGGLLYALAQNCTDTEVRFFQGLPVALFERGSDSKWGDLSLCCMLYRVSHSVGFPHFHRWVSRPSFVWFLLFYILVSCYLGSKATHYPLVSWVGNVWTTWGIARDKSVPEISDCILLTLQKKTPPCFCQHGTHRTTGGEGGGAKYRHSSLEALESEGAEERAKRAPHVACSVVPLAPWRDSRPWRSFYL